MDSKQDHMILIRNSSILKSLSRLNQRKLKRKEKQSNSISPDKPNHSSNFYNSRPKSSLNLLKNIQTTSKVQSKSSHIQEMKNLSTLLEKNSLNQNSESLNIDRKVLHDSVLSKITNLADIKVLLDYNFDVAQNNPDSNLLNKMLLQISKGCSICGYYCKQKNSKVVDLTDFNSKVFCLKCQNLFIVKQSVNNFVCEECSKGNILNKTNAKYVQIKICDNQGTLQTNPTQEFINLCSDRPINLTPHKFRGKKPELFND